MRSSARFKREDVDAPLPDEAEQAPLLVGVDERLDSLYGQVAGARDPGGLILRGRDADLGVETARRKR